MRFDTAAHIAQARQLAARDPQRRVQPGVLLRLAQGDTMHMQPAAAKIGPAEEWWVLRDKLLGGAAGPPWGVSRGNTEILVPVYEYLLADPHAENLIQFGAQIAAAAMGLLPPDRLVTRFFLALGSVLPRTDGQPGCSCWAGFAVGLRK